MLGDTWFLYWAGTSTEASLSPDASATPTSAHIEWDVASATGTHAAIYRRDTGGEWTAKGEGEVDVNGRLVYDDATVQAGSDYSYMMVVASERGETFGGETLVQVPGTTGVEPGLSTEFALRGAVPNPAFAQMTVSFTLASSEEATLDLVDVSGRLVLSRKVGNLGAGTHRIDLSSTRNGVEPGLYFLRLVQGARVATTRVAIGTR